MEWRKPPLSGTGVRVAYHPHPEGEDGREALPELETDGCASVTDAAVQDVTARLLAERLDGVQVWCPDTGRAEYAGGQSADPPAPGADPPAWYS